MALNAGTLISLVLALMVCCAREADPSGGSPPPVADNRRGPRLAAIDRDASVTSTVEALLGPTKGVDAWPAADASGSGAPKSSEASPREPLDSSRKMAAIHPGQDDLAAPLPPLIVIRHYDGKRFEMDPETRKGGFDAADLENAREAWAFRNGHKTHDVSPRLLDLLYQIQRHYDAPHVVLTSGFRPDRVTSYHAHGRALDLRIPGVKCRTLAKHLRTYGFVGVGVYPRTGGVHLDVRQKSYFWISYAPRGVRWPERGIDHAHAAQMDKQARERGIEPPEALPRVVQESRARRSAVLKRRRSRNKARRRAKAAKAPPKSEKRPPRPKKR